MPAGKRPHKVTRHSGDNTRMWAMSSSGLWLLSPAITGRLRSSPGQPWVHPNCATGGNKGQLLCRGLKVEPAPPRGHCSPEPAGTPQSRTTVAWQSKPPSALIRAVPKWRGKRSDTRSSSPVGIEGGDSALPLRTLKPLCHQEPPRQCSSLQQSIPALGKGTRGVPVSGLESGKTSLPATAAGRCHVLAWPLGCGSSGIQPEEAWRLSSAASGCRS